MISTNGTFLFQDAIERLPAYSNGVKLEIRTQNKSPLRLAYDLSNYVDFAVGSNGSLTINATGGIVISPNGNVIIKNGNVGIGTTAPSCKLDAETAGNNQIFRFGASSAGTGYLFGDMINTSGRLLLGVEGTSAGTLATGDLAYASVFGTVGPTGVQLAPNQVVAMTLLSGGNVGIGTISPSAKLEVAGTISANTIFVNGTIVSSTAFKGSNLNVPYGNICGSGTLAPAASGGISNLNSCAGDGKVSITVCSMQSTNIIGGHVYRIMYNAHGYTYNEFTDVMSHLSDANLSLTGTTGNCTFTNNSGVNAMWVVKQLPITVFESTTGGY